MVFFEKFETLQSFANTVSKREVNETFKECASCLASQMKNCTNTFGTSSFSEAENLLITGDRTNLSKLKEVSVKSVSHAKNYVKNILKVEKSVCGCLPNIPLFLNGAPNNMLTFKRTPLKSKVFTIIVNAGVSYETKCNQIIEAGSNIASIIKELEKNNIRVNLMLSYFSKSRENNNYIGTLINIKKASSPLNMLNIAYPLINPSMLRRHFLRYIETVPVKLDKSITNGYGIPLTFQEMLTVEPKLHKFKEATIIDIQEALNTSVDDMVKNISNKTK